MVVHQPGNTAEFADVRIYRYPTVAYVLGGLTTDQLIDFNQHILPSFPVAGGFQFQIPNQTDLNTRITKIQFKARGVATVNNTVSGVLASVPAPISGYAQNSISLDGSAIAQGLKAEEDELFTDQPVKNITIPTMDALFQLEPGSIFIPTVIMPAAAGHFLALYLWITVYSINRKSFQWP